jgi:DNA-binding LacI/PurR family transcriptional regulator
MVERVHAACVALKYRPSRAARSLAGSPSAILGLLVTDVQNPFFMEILRGVEDVAQKNGYLVILCNSKEDTDRERQYIEVLCAEAVAGAILVPAREGKTDLTVFAAQGIPVVAVDRQVSGGAIDSVMIDNVQAACNAVTHLLAAGYRRIGMIVGPLDTTTGRGRLAGYREALQRAGVPVDPSLERYGPLDEESGRRLAEELLALPEPVEALFAGNNWITMGILQAVHAHRLRIPGDLAIVGFDDLQWAELGSITLTSVVQPAYEMGCVATERLIQRLQHPDITGYQQFVLPYTLRVGDSSRPRERIRIPALG